MKVLIINQYAANKGDRAVAYALLRELTRNRVEKVWLSTHDPSLWKMERDFPGYELSIIPWGWNVAMPWGMGGILHRFWQVKSRFYRRLFPWLRCSLENHRPSRLLLSLLNWEFRKALLEADLVISTGGHHVTTLLDQDAINNQLFDMGCVLLVGKPLVLWSQSFGPFDFKDPRNALYVNNVLNGASGVYIRDDQSSMALKSFGVGDENIFKTHESVFCLNDLHETFVPPSARARRVGLAIYAAQRRPPEEHRNYVATMSQFINYCREKNYDISIFPMELEYSHSDDRWLIKEIMDRVPNHAGIDIRPDMPTREHLREVGACRMFVGHKTHSVVFSLVSGTPLIALAYHEKTNNFMNSFDLNEYCITDTQLTSATLIDNFSRLERNLDSISEIMSQHARDYGLRTRQDFAEMLGKYGN